MKLYSILGNPVSHSKSPIIHNAVFKRYSPESRYIRTPLLDGAKLKEEYLQLGLSGASVTVPHKESAFQLCDEVRGIAKDIGAVNCIVSENGKLIGYNTDVYGFLDSIASFENIKNVLIVGAGGTAKALTSGFLERGVKVSIVNRSEKRLEAFRDLLIKRYSWSTFEISEYDLVVNVTSAGLNDNQLPMAEEKLKEIFENSRYAVDVIYHETPFLKLAKSMGLKTKDGSLMLVYQGVLASRLFLENRVDRDNIEKAMLEALYISDL